MLIIGDNTVFIFLSLNFISPHLLQDVVQQNNTLIEEMLYLIIMLVGKFGLFETFINDFGFCDSK